MAKSKSTARGRPRVAQVGLQASNVVQFQKPTLVPAAVCKDTIEVLTELLEEAKSGNVIGLALVAMRKQRRYEFGITGEAARSPTFALWTVSMLQADIAMKIEANNN